MPLSPQFESAELVRSLFCGLPQKENRVAVILAASDETSGKSFIYGGVIAPVNYWERIFVKQWDRDVLGGSPRIPYLHMTDIRSREWREQIGISEEEAERRVDNAVGIICKRKYPVMFCVRFDREAYENNGKKYLRKETGGKFPLVPDYLAFMLYAARLIRTAKKADPTIRKVDFLVERNGGITKHIEEFYREIEPFFRKHGDEDLAPLVGDIIPGSKDRSPLQAADLVCWHVRRFLDHGVDAETRDRHRKLMEKRVLLLDVKNDAIKSYGESLKDAANVC